jgi:hypothetical protein
MPDYQKGKIYTIRNNHDKSLIYVGSTIQSLSQRMVAHRSDSKKDKDKDRKIYQHIGGKWEDWYIELYELFPCNSKEELCKREGEVIREIGTLNNLLPGRTPKEYYQDNHERYKEYREENKEKKIEYDKQYRELNVEKKRENDRLYREKNEEAVKQKKREYHIKNRERINAKSSLFYQNNKEKYKEKITCECGITMNKCYLPKHLKTKNHLDYIKHSQ